MGAPRDDSSSTLPRIRPVGDLVPRGGGPPGCGVSLLVLEPEDAERVIGRWRRAGPPPWALAAPGGVAAEERVVPAPPARHGLTMGPRPSHLRERMAVTRCDEGVVVARMAAPEPLGPADERAWIALIQRARGVATRA